MKKLLDSKRVAFMHYLREVRGYSKLTIRSYDASLQEALGFVEIEQKNKKFVINLMPYRMHIAELNPKTISKKLSAIRSFTKYLNENGVKVTLQSDATLKVAKTLPKPIAHKHILEALHEASLQEKLIVIMLYTLGLRISELGAIELQDISEKWLRVTGKGNKQRDVPILEATKKLLDEYLSHSCAKKFLFEKKGEKLSENSLRYTITKVFERVGLKVTPHQLRHSYATSLLNGGAPIVDVSELLGHASMATTQIYTKLGSALKQENYHKAHPLCKGEQ